MKSLSNIFRIPKITNRYKFVVCVHFAVIAVFAMMALATAIDPSISKTIPRICLSIVAIAYTSGFICTALFYHKKKM